MTFVFKTLAAGIVAVAMLCGNAAEAKLKRITIGSNPAGSVFFMLSSGFAKLFQEKLGIRSTAQPHAGSTVHIPLSNAGELTLGMNNSMDSGAAWLGKKPFKKKMANLRGIARVWVIPFGYLVKGNSGIKSISQLRDKRVVVEIPTIYSLGSLHRTMLLTEGITVKDVTGLKSGGIVKSMDMLIQGRAEAVAAAYSMPAVRKAHASVPGGIRYLPLKSGTTNAFMNKHTPGTRTFMAKPSKRYPYITENTLIGAFDAYLNAGKQVSDDDGYLLAKTLHQNWKALQKAYPPTRGVKSSQIAPATNSHPYHPGAVRYFKEAGIWSAANEKRQAEVLKQ